MARSRPAFDLHEDSEASLPPSRSTSRDRSHLPHQSPRPHPPPPLSHHNSSSRRYSHDEGSGVDSPRSAHHLLCDVDEESALGLETDSLLSSSKRTGSGRRLTLSSVARPNGYGGVGDSPRAGFLALNEAGAPLKRQESVLRLAGLIDDRAGEYERFRKSPEELRKMNRKVRRFYERQNEQLDGFKEVDEILENTRAKALTGELVGVETRADRDEDFRASVRWAVNLNFVINILLLGAKIAVVLLSHSMSLVASTVDSAMDFLSTLIIFYTSKVIEHKDWKSQYAYPSGKSRMEPLGVLTFSVFMISSFLQVLVESVQKLLDPNLEQAQLPPVALGVMIATIVIKSAVWVSCRAIKSASVEALQQDAENDIVFNIGSTLFPFLGQILGWRYLDPLGGALLSLYIIIEWSQTLFENVRKLTGKRAPPQEHQRIAYLLTRFSPLITAVQHLSLYYAGEGMLCEVDIILPAETSLRAAHDVGEAAQYAIEELSGIERCYCHVDLSVNPLSGHLER
ncbi:hypothetical protein JCM6882_001715 [Rhodosporidiobolus microsporus]